MTVAVNDSPPAFTLRRVEPSDDGKIAGSSVCPKSFRIGILYLFISVLRY